MTALVWLPVVIAGAAALWWLSRNTPKGVMIAIGVLLNLAGRYLASSFHQVYGIEGERLGSFAHQLLADLALPLQLLGVIAVIHGIILLFRRRNQAPNQPPPP